MYKGPEESEFVANFGKLQEIWYAGIIDFKVKMVEEEPDDGELGKLFGQFLETFSSRDQISFQLVVAPNIFLSILILHATFSHIHNLINILNRKCDKDLFDFITY